MKLGEKQKKWLEELRSGKYAQGKKLTNPLKNSSNELCCLGVVAVGVLGLAETGVSTSEILEEETSHGLFPVMFEDGSEYTLHSYENLGLVSGQGSFKKSMKRLGKVYHSLAEMNDAGVSFKEIADYIEKYPENVFTKSV